MDQKSKRKATSSSHPNRFQLGVISTYHWNLKTKDKLNNEDNFKEEDDLKNEGIPKKEDVPKKEDDFKNGDHPKYEDDPKNTAKRNMSSAVCASSMYSRLCMKMSSFLFVRLWTMPRISYSSCGILFPV